MSNVALSSANKNTTQTNFTQLDIGGGPDNIVGELDVSRSEVADGYEGRLKHVRSALLAKANPDGSYVVFDPGLEMDIAKQVEEEIPNLGFVEGKVDVDHKLPFDDGSMDVVEINHLFAPVIIAGNVKPKEEALAKKRQEFELDWLSSAQVDAKMKPYTDELEDFIAKQPKQLAEEGTARDFKDYLMIVEEASRVLKSGGKLLLGEKWARMQPILRVISKDDRLQCDGEIMDELGLELVSLKDNNDPNRSSYAEGAANTRDFHITNGDREKSEDFRPLVLTLQKIPAN